MTHEEQRELRAELVKIALRESLREHFGIQQMGRVRMNNEERAAFAVSQADAVIKEMRKA